MYITLGSLFALLGAVSSQFPQIFYSPYRPPIFYSGISPNFPVQYGNRRPSFTGRPTYIPISPPPVFFCTLCRPPVNDTKLPETPPKTIEDLLKELTERGKEAREERERKWAETRKEINNRMDESSKKQQEFRENMKKEDVAHRERLDDRRKKHQELMAIEEEEFRAKMQELRKREKEAREKADIAAKENRERAALLWEEEKIEYELKIKKEREEHEKMVQEFMELFNEKPKIGSDGQENLNSVVSETTKTTSEDGSETLVTTQLIKKD